MKKVDEKLIAYVAGFFDGEGCVSVWSKGGKKGSYTFGVIIVNTNPIPLGICKDIFGGSIYKETRGGPRRPLWIWRCSYNKAIKFINAILPYSIIKKPELEVALEYAKTLKGNNNRQGISISVRRKRERIKKELKELKRQPYLM